MINIELSSRQKEIIELNKHLQSIIGLLERATEKAWILYKEESNYYHNIPENYAVSARTSKSEEAVEALDIAHENLAACASKIKISMRFLNDAAS